MYSPSQHDVASNINPWALQLCYTVPFALWSAGEAGAAAAHARHAARHRSGH